MNGGKGTYALLLALEEETSIAVGKLGLLSFPSGHYLYFGSALGGLRQRVRRHLRRDKKIRWHIDYLLERARVSEVWYVLSQEALECIWRQTALGLPGGESPVQGFGSSDCRCPSHLIHFPSPPPLTLFRKRLGQQVKRGKPKDLLPQS